MTHLAEGLKRLLQLQWSGQQHSSEQCLPTRADPREALLHAAWAAVDEDIRNTASQYYCNANLRTKLYGSSSSFSLDFLILESCAPTHCEQCKAVLGTAVLSEYKANVMADVDKNPEQTDLGGTHTTSVHEEASQTFMISKL